MIKWTKQLSIIDPKEILLLFTNFMIITLNVEPAIIRRRMTVEADSLWRSWAGAYYAFP